MKIKMVAPKKAKESHDAGVPASFEPFENDRKSNEPEDVEEQRKKMRAEIQRRLKGIEKVALETKGKDFVGEEIKESLKNRNELAKLVSSLKEQNIQYKISRSAVEGMRYDVTYRKLNEHLIDDGFYAKIRSDEQAGDVRPNEEQRKAGEENDWEGFELDHGYGVFKDGDDQPYYIARIDDMGVFDGDIEAMNQAEKDGFERMRLTDSQIEWIKNNTNVLPDTVIKCDENSELLGRIDESLELKEAVAHPALDAEIRRLNAPDEDGERNFEFVVEEKNGMLRIYDKRENYNSGYLDELNSMMADVADEFGFTFKPAETDKIHDAIEKALRKDRILTDDNVLEWEDNVVMSIALPEKNEAYNAKGMAYYEYPEGSGCHVRETSSCFVAIDEHGTNVGESETREGAEAILDAKLNEGKCNEDLDEEAEQYIYLFPQDGMDEDDIDALDDYNLTYLGKNEFEDEDDRGRTWVEKNLVVVGTKANLERYADEYLAGYSLHPDYLYKKDEFGGEIIYEDKKGEVCPDCKKSPCVCEDKILHESRGEHVDEQTGWLINGTLDEFEPKTLIDAVKERKRNLHTNRIVKDTDDHKIVYHIGIDLLGHDLDDADVWVDVIKSEWKRDEDDEFNETQDRVLMKNCDSEPDKWDKAIDIINKWKESTLKEPIEEGLNESMKSEVVSWWKEVEDKNKELGWGFSIDNEDYEDADAMLAAMFDMLKDLKGKDDNLFKKGKSIYNKYAKYSKYNESISSKPIEEDKAIKGMKKGKLYDVKKNDVEIDDVKKDDEDEADVDDLAAMRRANEIVYDEVDKKAGSKAKVKAAKDAKKERKAKAKRFDDMEKNDKKLSTLFGKGKKKNESVDWDYYVKFDAINDKYLPDRGEGENKATQATTAINKLVYKWYNDGDVFDNHYALANTCNDLSSFANWLYDNVKEVRPTLRKIKTISNEGEYEDLLKELCDAILDEKKLEEWSKVEKDGSVYENNEFPFSVDWGRDEDSYEDEEEEEEVEESKETDEGLDEATGYDHYGAKEMKPFKGPAYIQYDGGSRQIDVLTRARNHKWVWKNIAGISDDEWYIFPSFEDALKVQKEVGGEIMSWNAYTGVKEKPEEEKVDESIKDKNMNEARWNKVVSDHGLHQAIDDEDYDGIRDAVLGIIREVREFLGDEEESQDIIDGLEDAQDNGDEVDYWLGELYDLCDNVGVFIRLDEGKCEEVEEALKSDMSHEELQDKLNSMNLESSLEATLKSLDGSANIEESKKLKESWYRGCEGVEFIWNGTQSDPELEYKGKTFNYWDVEDALWDMFLEDGGSKDDDESAFDAYVREHCKDYLDDWLASGDMKFEKLDESKEQELIDVIKYDYGMDDDEAKALANTLSDEAKSELIRGWKDEARKEFGEVKERECEDCFGDDAECFDEHRSERAKSEDGLKEDLRIICSLDDYSPWAGAVELWDEIVDNDKKDDLEFILEDAYPEGITMTQLNDLLWFDGDTVREWLGLEVEDE